MKVLYLKLLIVKEEGKEKQGTVATWEDRSQEGVEVVSELTFIHMTSLL